MRTMQTQSHWNRRKKQLALKRLELLQMVMDICLFLTKRTKAFTCCQWQMGSIMVCSHCVICDCDLFLRTMGCIGVGDVVAVA